MQPDNPSKITILSDGSVYSILAIQHAVDKLIRSTDLVYLVHARYCDCSGHRPARTYTYHCCGLDMDCFDTSHFDCEQQARTVVKTSLAPLAHHANVKIVEIQQKREAPAAHVLYNTIRHIGPDVVVMSANGLGHQQRIQLGMLYLEKHPIGSTAMYLLEHLPYTMLLVK